MRVVRPLLSTVSSIFLRTKCLVLAIILLDLILAPTAFRPLCKNLWAHFIEWLSTLALKREWRGFLKNVNLSRIVEAVHSWEHEIWPHEITAHGGYDWFRFFETFDRKIVRFHQNMPLLARSKISNWQTRSDIFFASFQEIMNSGGFDIIEKTFPLPY